MRVLAFSCLFCVFAQAFTLYAFIEEKRANIASLQALGQCEVLVDKATHIMSKREQWKFNHIINGASR
jgi:hypothetical protein